MLFKHTVGYVYAFIAVFFWSFSVIISKHLASFIEPFQLATIKWGIAFCVLLPFAYASIRRHFDLIWKYKKLVLAIALTGIVSFNLMMYHAAHETSAINMSLIGSLGPLFLVLFSRLLFHIKISITQVIGYMMTILGIIIVITKSDLSLLLNLSFSSGDLWMLGGAVCFGLYGSLQHLKSVRLPMLDLLVSSMFVGLLFLIPSSFIFGDYQNIQWNTEIILFIAYLGVIISGLTFFLWNKALYELGSVKAGLLYYIQPILSLIWASVFLHESISKSQMYGAILVLFGILFSHLKSIHKNKFLKL